MRVVVRWRSLPEVIAFQIPSGGWVCSQLIEFRDID
jgi:hypothetical protein